MKPRARIGMLTPSSNTVVEPTTSGMLNSLPEVTAHFARFPVAEIALDKAALDQFDDGPMLAASELLAHAKVDVICWNGASAGWLGFDRDVALCGAIRERTGITACSSTLAILEIFESTRLRRFGLLSPYVSPVQDAIVANFRRSGFECSAERHLEMRDNFSFSEVPEETLKDMARAVALEGKPDALLFYCSNLRSAGIGPALEAELGLPVYDMVQVAVWRALVVAGVSPNHIEGWGRVFQTVT